MPVSNADVTTLNTCAGCLPPWFSSCQYHPGSFGGSFVQRRRRGYRARVFHFLAAPSSVSAMGPLKQHPMVSHATYANVSCSTMRGYGAPHAGHGFSFSGIEPPVPSPVQPQSGHVSCGTLQKKGGPYPGSCFAGNFWDYQDKSGMGIWRGISQLLLRTLRHPSSPDCQHHFCTIQRRSAFSLRALCPVAPPDEVTLPPASPAGSRFPSTRPAGFRGQ